ALARSCRRPRRAPSHPAKDSKMTVRRKHPLMRALEALASLRLTVALLVLSLLLLFFGTLAQIDAGIWTVTRTYFRSFMVWVPFQALVQFGQVFFPPLVPRDFRVGLAFPFPGGWTLGCLLLVNLLAAHALRFRLSWQRSGVLILHSGLILLMLNEFITG